jgi:hypothetical protein
MPICKLCNVNNGIYHVRNKTTKEIFYICEFCEEPKDIELIEDKRELPKQKTFNEEGWGRLHLVKKTKKLANCRLCLKEIPIGSTCYNQAQHLVQVHIQKKVCQDCSNKLIKEGTEVVS